MRVSTWKRLSSVAMLTLVPLALACQGGEQGQEGAMEGEMEASEGMQESMEPSETVSLQAMGDATISGDVEFTRDGNTLTVELMAQMGSPGDYPSHIHEGTCEEPGGVAVPLTTSTAHEPGIAEGTSEVDLGQLDAGGSYLVMIHSQQGAPAGCAPVPASLLEGAGSSGES